MDSDNDLPHQPPIIKQKPINSFNMTKASKNKLSTRQLLKLLLMFLATLLELFILRLAIAPLILGGIFLTADFFTNKWMSFHSYLIYFVLLFLFLLLISFKIRRVGAEEVWKDLILYDLYYSGKSDKYIKWFLYPFIIGCIILALITALVLLLGLFAR